MGHLVCSSLFAIITLGLASCGPLPGEPAEPPPRPAATLPGPSGQALAPPADDPTALPGVPIDALNLRERRAWWKLISQLYAPCPGEAVSIRQCVAEARACVTCKPAAELLATKIHEGASMEQAQTAYARRFGPSDLAMPAVAGSPSHGPTDAPVTVMVWSDFECPHCKMTMPILDRLVEKFAGKVRLVHKFYPLSQHPNAKDAARAAIAAQRQGKYWEMERLLFENQHALSPQEVDGYAAKLKLDMTRYKRDMNDASTMAIIDRDHEDAERTGLTGTPHILINGRIFELGLFHVDRDLEGWIALDIELASTGK